MLQAFPRTSRLTTRDEFTRVQRTGRRVGTPHMTLFALPNSHDRSRLGLVASRRVGPAVVRNRMKRRLRELFRRHTVLSSSLQTSRRFDVVIVARSGLASVAFSAVEAEFASAIGRLR